MRHGGEKGNGAGEAETDSGPGGGRHRSAVPADGRRIEPGRGGPEGRGSAAAGSGGDPGALGAGSRGRNALRVPVRHTAGTHVRLRHGGRSAGGPGRDGQRGDRGSALLRTVGSGGAIPDLHLQGRDQPTGDVSGQAPAPELAGPAGAVHCGGCGSGPAVPGPTDGGPGHRNPGGGPPVFRHDGPAADPGRAADLPQRVLRHCGHRGHPGAGEDWTDGGLPLPADPVRAHRHHCGLPDLVLSAGGRDGCSRRRSRRPDLHHAAGHHSRRHRHPLPGGQLPADHLPGRVRGADHAGAGGKGVCSAHLCGADQPHRYRP